MKKSIGILAHADAGKTSLSELLLYHASSIRKPGRVDHKDSFLDSHSIEKERGITVFSGQAVFRYRDSTYYLIDTPGHVDFSSEMERALSAVDYAVVVVSCAEGVQGHTETIWRLLCRYRIPVFFFLNKTDRDGADPERVLRELARKFSPACLDFTGLCTDGRLQGDLIEAVAGLSDPLLEAYLEQGYQDEEWRPHVLQMIRERALFPCFCGSALQDLGVAAFLHELDALTTTFYHQQLETPFAAQVSKIQYDKQNTRLTFLRLTSGRLSVKDSIPVLVRGETEPCFEKVNEIRVYNGTRFTPAPEASAGDFVAVSGPVLTRAGMLLGRDAADTSFCSIPVLASSVQFDPAIPVRKVLELFRILEEEDPMLHVTWEEGVQEIHVHVMGAIQLEILQELVLQRFGITVHFGACSILYQETISAEVTGYGHFEPLRHYAEVHLRLSPGKRGSGIQFASACPAEVLGVNYQNLVRTHLFEREQKGILTNSPLTDLRITLVNGRAHLKHTQGGDFREATFRALRQGLEQADSVLLEPYYAFEVTAATTYLGRILSDIQKFHGTFQPPESDGETMLVKGRGPVSAFLEFAQELIGHTRGTGRFHAVFDGYEPCHNSKEVIAAIGYRKELDMTNPSGSVFCAKGAGFLVKWEEVPHQIHCKE